MTALDVAAEWFAAEDCGFGVTRIFEPHVDPYLGGNAWLVEGAERDALLDTGTGIGRLRPVVEAPAMIDPTLDTSLATAYVSDAMLRALPEADYTTAHYTLTPAPPTELFEDDNVIELGERRLRVLHLPGWTAGSMGVWEQETGLLFTSDTLYDDAQFTAKQDDEPPYADAGGFADSLARLRGLPVTTVHGGHFESFGRGRMIELIDGWVEAHARAAPRH